MTHLELQQTRFNAWLSEMSPAIARFIASAPQSMRSELNHNPQSLVTLERWILARYADSAELLKKSEEPFLDGAARYVGEMLRVPTHSKWAILLDDPKQAFFGLPVLSGGKLAADVCPLSLVTASANRRTGAYLSTVFSNLVA